MSRHVEHCLSKVAGLWPPVLLPPPPSLTLLLTAPNLWAPF